MTLHGFRKKGWVRVVSSICLVIAVLFTVAAVLPHSVYAQTQTSGSQSGNAGGSGSQSGGTGIIQKAKSLVASGIGALGDVTSGFVTTLAFLAIYDMAVVVGVIVALEAWLIGVILNINDGIFQTVFVQSGFSIALSIANLAFVLGIIVIAIATIIRNESYGVKKLLWKLVVAAVLVNFGLVIAAPIFGLSNSFSHYFVNCINPAGGGCSQSFNGFESWDNFATTFAGSFQPQNSFSFVTGGSVNNKTDILSSKGLNSLSGALAATGANDGKELVALMGVLFGATNLLLIVLVLGGLLVLLFIRYIYIAILAILMPFAWASWVFPIFGNHWKKWWSKFLQWSFFAPIALFFIYLSMLLMQVSNGTTGVGSLDLKQYNNGGIFTALSGFFAGALSQLLPAILQELIFAGLIIGGLFAANSMGIKGASAVTGAITSAGNGVKTWAGKKSKQAAGRMVPKDVKNKLQSGGYRFIPQRLQVATGVGLGNLERAGRGDTVAAQAKYAENLAKDPAALARALAQKSGTLGRGAMSHEEQMAVLDKLSKDENLRKDVVKAAGVGSLGGLTVNGQNFQDFLKQNEGKFKDLQQEKSYEELKDQSGLTIHELAEKNKDAEKTVLEFGDKAKAQEFKDVYEKWGSGTPLSPSEKGVFDAYSNRLDELNKLEGKGALTDPEKDEIKTLREIQNTPTGHTFITNIEKDQYDTAKLTFDENIGKIKRLIKDHPDLVADSFQDFSKASAKFDKDIKIGDKRNKPLTFDPAAVKNMQQSIITAMAEGLSPQNAKELLKSLGTKNNLKYFEDAPQSMDAKTLAQIQSLARSNKTLASYIKNNPGRDAVDLNEMFGIRPKKYKKDEDED